MIRTFAQFRGFWFKLKCRALGRRIQIGRGLEIYKRLDIRGPGEVRMGCDCKVAGIRGDAKQFVTLYTMNADAVIAIGSNARLFAARISCKFAVTLGDDVLIEEAGITDTDFHSLDKERKNLLNESREKCRVMIGDRVCIGARTIITKGTAIGDDAIIGPGSIVNRNIPPQSFAIGNPARVVNHP